jgi:membrane protein YqaA with SNARE-associated domain
LLRKLANALVTFGPWGVFLIGFVDSLGVPLPAAIDAMLITVAIEAPQRAYFTALMAVLGSAGGNIMLFLLARYGRNRFIRRNKFINAEPPPGKRQKFQKWFHRYGLLTVFIPAVTPVAPLPLKVFVVSAGAMHTPFGKFLLVILLARVIRYFGEAYLGIRLGHGAHAFLAANAWTIAGVVLAMVLAAAALIRFTGRGREVAL